MKPPAVPSPEESRILQGTGEATLVENGSFDTMELRLQRTSSVRSPVTSATNAASSTDMDRRRFDRGRMGRTQRCCRLRYRQRVQHRDAQQRNLLLGRYCHNPPTYRLEGTVDAFVPTSEGTSTLSRTYGDASAGQGETIEGAGMFEGTGTFNGTGLFIGVGSFSGPMVEPGSFYKTDCRPVPTT